MKRRLGLATCGVVVALASAGVAGASVGGGGSANPNAGCQGFLVSNSTVPFSHIIQNDIRTTPGLEEFIETHGRLPFANLKRGNRNAAEWS